MSELGNASTQAFALWAGLNLALMVLLSMNVARHRFFSNTTFGMGDDPVFQHAIRTHANNSENVPVTLLAIAVLVVLGYSSTWIHALGGALLVGRLLHAIGLGIMQSKMDIPPPRAIGMVITWSVMLVCAVAMILAFSN